MNKAKIIELLMSPLPGELAQYKMAPFGRKLSVANRVGELRNAAVLVPIFEKEGELHVILTLRNTYDGIHSAQVSFPGGKFENGENDEVVVAMRETYEELGLEEKYIEVLGKLSSLIIPVSSMNVYPVVGWIDSRFELKPDRREVDRVIIAPVSSFYSSEVKYSNTILKQGVEVPYFLADGEIVWGATAMIISEFIDAIAIGLDS